MSNPHLIAPAPRILIISTRYLGDLLLVTPLLDALHQLYPAAQLDVLCLTSSAAIVRGHPLIHQIHTISARPNWAEQRQLWTALYQRYDLALITLTGDRPHLYGRLAARYRIGLVDATPAPRLGLRLAQSLKRHWLQQAIPFNDRDTHTVTQNLALIHALINDLTWQARYPLSCTVTQAHDIAQHAQVMPVTDASSKQHNQLPSQPFVILHMAPQWRYKQWTIEGWQTVITWLLQQQLHIVCTGGTATAEQDYIQTIIAPWLGDARIHNQAGQLSFATLATWLKAARLYIGPDTSVTHLAAACGTPTIALFGPTNPVKWAPYPKKSDVIPWKMIQPLQRMGNVTLIQGEGACVPCHQAGCDRHNNSHSQCLLDLSPERVIAQIEHMTQLQAGTNHPHPKNKR